MRKYSGCWLASAAFALDRFTKWMAASKLRGGGPAEIVPGILRFAYVENTGAAFGLFGRHTIPLVLFTAAILIGLVAFLLYRGSMFPSPARYALWLLAGGAAGNFADRLFSGYVVDFIELRFITFPVFNIADCCVSVSVVLLTGWILLHREVLPDAR